MLGWSDLLIRRRTPFPPVVDETALAKTKTNPGWPATAQLTIDRHYRREIHGALLN